MERSTYSSTDLNRPLTQCRTVDSSRTQCMHRSMCPSQQTPPDTLLTGQRISTLKRRKKLAFFAWSHLVTYVHLVGHAQENYLDFHWRQLNKGKLKTAAQVVLLFSHTHTHFTHIHISLLTTYSWCCVTTDLLTKPWIDTLPVWCKITCYFEIIYNSILWYSKNFYCTSYFLSLFLDLV